LKCLAVPLPRPAQLTAAVHGLEREELLSEAAEVVVLRVEVVVVGLLVRDEVFEELLRHAVPMLAAPAGEAVVHLDGRLLHLLRHGEHLPYLLDLLNLRVGLELDLSLQKEGLQEFVWV